MTRVGPAGLYDLCHESHPQHIAVTGLSVFGNSFVPPPVE
jgi:hypothetical protein